MVLPDLGGDVVSGFCEFFWRAVSGRFFDAGFGVELLRVFGDLAIADEAFDDAGGTFAGLVDGGVTDLAGAELCAAVELAVDDEAAANSGAEGDGDEVSVAFAGAVVPLGVGHAVGVVVYGDGEFGFLAEAITEGDFDPAGDVGDLENVAPLEIDEAGDACADGADVGVGGFEFGDAGGDGVDEVVGRFVVEGGGVDGLGVGDDSISGADAEFYGGASEVDTDG